MEAQFNMYFMIISYRHHICGLQSKFSCSKYILFSVCCGNAACLEVRPCFWHAWKSRRCCV